MGLGDVSEMVIPKPLLIAKPNSDQGSVCARYFMPHRCHKAIAVTGSIALTMSLCYEGTVASQLLGFSDNVTS